MVKKERSDDMQEERGEVKNETKGKGKGKGKAKGENHVRHGSLVCELSRDRHAADPWDDFLNGWAEFLQSEKGGQGTHHNRNRNHNHNHNHNQQRKQQEQHHNHNHNHNHTHHPDGQQSGSGSSQSRWCRGDGGAQVHAGQKRSATETVSNGHNGHAVKRHKGERTPPPSSRSGPDPEPNSDSGAMRRHPDFWLFDGSVIIQIEKTEFRLHQSTLQKYSEYFAAAFREKAGGYKRDGRAYVEVEVDERSPSSHHLPVYRVTETTADDFAALLTVIEGM